MTSTTDHAAQARCFISIDAETEVLAQGIASASAIRERVAREFDTRIPIVWFVRFQRTWNEYVKNDSIDYFSTALKSSFDGFDLGNSQLREFQQRGDEIGWHYHAYNYVHRDDLSHEHKIAILRADLTACRAELARRHPEFAVRSFRFGWFFVPDYNLYPLLNEPGVRVDATVRPEKAGQKVKGFDLYRLPAISTVPQKLDGIWFVPVVRAHVLHDFDLIAHDLGWKTQDEAQASRKRDDFEAMLSAIAREARESGNSPTTYREAFA